MELIQQMNVVLATAFNLYLQAHGYHWNVTGLNFKQYHDFFGDVYEQVFDTIDEYAEHIRALDAYPITTLPKFLMHSKITINEVDGQYAMMSQLHASNLLLLSELVYANELATKYNKTGLSNFLQDKIDQHEKLNWMIKSHLE